MLTATEPVPRKPLRLHALIVKGASISRSSAVRMLVGRIAYERATVAGDETRYADAGASTKTAYASYSDSPIVSMAASDDLRNTWERAQVREQVLLESLAASRGRELAASRELLAMVLP